MQCNNNFASLFTLRIEVNGNEGMMISKYPSELNITQSSLLKFDGRVESLRKRDKKMKGIMIRNYFNYSKTGQST